MYSYTCEIKILTFTGNSKLSFSLSLDNNLHVLYTKQSNTLFI